MLKQIIPAITPHVCFCEPFAGGLAVLFAKERSKVEIVNDVNGDLVALYRNLQYHLPALLGELDWLFSSRQNLMEFKQQPGLTELQRAARFLLMNRTSFAGNMRSFGVVKTARDSVAFDHKAIAPLLARANDRLDGVVVEHLPYERCLKNYDSPDTFFFMDPPYLNADTGAYDGWSEAKMREFSGRVRSLQGNWITTVDDSEFNRKLFSGCAIKPVSAQNRLCNVRTHSSVRFGELIITPK